MTDEMLLARVLRNPESHSTWFFINVASMQQLFLKVCVQISQDSSHIPQKERERERENGGLASRNRPFSLSLSLSYSLAPASRWQLSGYGVIAEKWGQQEAFIRDLTAIRNTRRRCTAQTVCPKTPSLCASQWKFLCNHQDSKRTSGSRSKSLLKTVFIKNYRKMLKHYIHLAETKTETNTLSFK